MKNTNDGTPKPVENYDPNSPPVDTPTELRKTILAVDTTYYIGSDKVIEQFLPPNFYVDRLEKALLALYRQELLALKAELPEKESIESLSKYHSYTAEQRAKDIGHNEAIEAVTALIDRKIAGIS